MITQNSVYKKLFILLIILVPVLISLWVFIKYKPTKKELPLTQTSTSTPVVLVSTTTSTSAPRETKPYRNEEFGFEFQYPKNWKLEENSFKSPFSKFNLQGDVAAKDYNPFFPLFLLNIVTQDFADRAIVGWRQSGGIESEIVVGGIRWKKFEYIKPHPGISVILSFEKYGIILATKNKDNVNVFNQILASFKFLSKTQ